jgi:hypothetical protein
LSWLFGLAHDGALRGQGNKAVVDTVKHAVAHWSPLAVDARSILCIFHGLCDYDVQCVQLSAVRGMSLDADSTDKDPKRKLCWGLLEAMTKE